MMQKRPKADRKPARPTGVPRRRSSPDPKLLQAHVVFRHAQRLPCERFFDDDDAFWGPKVAGIEAKEGIDVQSALLNASDGDRAFAEAPGVWRKQMMTGEGWDQCPGNPGVSGLSGGQRAF